MSYLNGSRVEVRGLQGAGAVNNGRFGTVIKFNKKRQGYVVELDACSEDDQPERFVAKPHYLIGVADDIDLAFEEIQADDYVLQFVCTSHKRAVCGQCCMDFSLLNQLRYDEKYLVATIKSKQMDRIQGAIEEHYISPPVVENCSGAPSSPNLPGLLDRA